ncbi:MAG: substrate-binding domain-containing protein, partial [Clostridiales bacterium]|nr:substrate-binding domain-containing protein [Clostridiales bacterium]
TPGDCIDCGEGEFDSVGLDDIEGGRLITDFLLSQGHRRIAFFSDLEEMRAGTLNRYRGYCEALKKYGIIAADEDCYYLPDDYSQRHETLRYFAVNVKGMGYTAVVVASDLLASEAINVFFEEGLSVPEDISVTGFDDNIYARMSRPMLTTVRQPVAEKGEQAVKLLMQRIRREKVLVRSYKLPVELIVRDSVANRMTY